MKYKVYVEYVKVFETDSAREAWETAYQMYREDPLRAVCVITAGILTEIDNSAGSLIGHNQLLRTVWTHESPEVKRIDYLESLYDQIACKDIIDASAAVLKYVFGI